MSKPIIVLYNHGMLPLFKWPGGKTRELPYIRAATPTHSRFIEPFVGGGAVFFDMEPERAVIADINPTLIACYNAMASKTPAVFNELTWIEEQRASIKTLVPSRQVQLLAWFTTYRGKKKVDIISSLSSDIIAWKFSHLKLSGITAAFARATADKIVRIDNMIVKKGIDWTDEDIANQMLTGLYAGLYTHVRDNWPGSEEARFLYLREFCYGSMFRYSKEGKFNIPYGGASYNDKDFAAKITRWTSSQVVNLLARAEKICLSFTDFDTHVKLASDDFLFLDPPYDSDFTDYDQYSFRSTEQGLLAKWFTYLPCPALMIIGKTELTERLYSEAQKTNSAIVIDEYEKNYTYNVRGRNNRAITHLGIRNYPISLVEEDSDISSE